MALVYEKDGLKKRGDLLEVYKIKTDADAKRYMEEPYNKFKLVYDTLLAKGPIFLIKYNGEDVVRIGPDLNVTVGKKEVQRTFKDSEKEKTVKIPYTIEEILPFLNHVDRNYKDKDFQSYVKEFKEQNSDIFKFSSSWGKGREGLDASTEEVPPIILKEVEVTEKKLTKLKDLINLMKNKEQNKEKITELTREIDFDEETGTFVRTAPMIASNTEEATFLRTAPEKEEQPSKYQKFIEEVEPNKYQVTYSERKIFDSIKEAEEFIESLKGTHEID